MEELIRIESTADRVEVHVTGKLTKEAYENFVPVLEREFHERGQLRLLFVMHDFHGWTAGALWEDIKFDVAHFRDVARLAIVGETRWQHGMAVFCKPFTTAKIKYFDVSELDAARAWLKEPLVQRAGGG
jgi:hypothetical protein